EHGVYLDQCVYTLTGELDVSAFEQAWQILSARHSVLRTSFHWEGLDEPLQIVHKNISLPFERRDWSNLSETEQKTALEDLLKKDRARGVDITQAPLMRLMLIQTGDASWMLLWTMHHLLLDRWSTSLILSELAQT